MQEIKVHVVKYPDRQNLMLRYRCPLTGRHKAKSAGTASEKKALKAAGEWEEALNSGRYAAPSRVTWGAFREKYETEVLAGLAPATQHKTGYMLDVLERILKPERVRDITAARLSHLQAELRKGQKLKGRARRPCSPATVDGYLRTIRAVLALAVEWGYLPAMPKVRSEKRSDAASKAKGRALCGEEFDKMLAAVPRVLKARPNTLGVDVVTPWRHYLQGLWLSGLRLGESLRLYWNREDSPSADYLEIDLMSYKRPMLVIPAGSHKGKRDVLLPITPDFAEFLEAVPATQRRGPVFNPEPLRRHEGRERRQERVSNTIAAIGRAAGVVVNDSGKCASAHDLRRSFAKRWAGRVMPHCLMQLMRHREIATTMAYYAGRDAEAVADQVWGLLGNNLGNTAPNEAFGQAEAVAISTDPE
ncbi:MAG: site-specific integrase [Pirellulales bacterium]|nr:site-specific integrase [Pirellulales bacterium]